MKAHENPFRSSRVGELSFEFKSGESMESLLQKWELAGRTGAIVGPMGRGKSTLLRELKRVLEGRSYSVTHFRLSIDSSPALLFAMAFQMLRIISSSCLRPNKILTFALLIDGWEQFPQMVQSVLGFVLKTTRTPIWVTAHQATHFPTLYECESSPELFGLLLTRLDLRTVKLSQDAIAMSYLQENGNIRRAFHQLYEMTRKNH